MDDEYGHAQADNLTRIMRSKLGWGSVEYAEAEQEFVIWPLGEPYSTPEAIRERIEVLRKVDDHGY